MVTFSGMGNENLSKFLEPFYKFLRLGIEEGTIVDKIMTQLRQPALELVRVRMQDLQETLTVASIESILREFFPTGPKRKSGEEVWRIIEAGPGRTKTFHLSLPKPILWQYLQECLQN